MANMTLAFQIASGVLNLILILASWKFVLVIPPVLGTVPIPDLEPVYGFGSALV